MRCYFVWDEEQKKKVLIPYCYGSLHMEDKSNCCCEKPQSFKQFEKEEYNKRLKELTDDNEHLVSENNRLIMILERIINTNQ